MINKEELEKLIEQEATIYTTKPSYRDCGIRLDNKHFKIIGNELMFTYKDYKILLEQLYKNKAEAEWVAKIYATRVERFEPPMELNYNNPFKFFGKDKKYYEITCNEEKTRFAVEDAYFEIEHFKNYTEAVEYARRLFLGENDE